MYSRKGLRRIYTKNMFVLAYSLDSQEDNATDCEYVCVVQTREEIVISTVYMSRSTPKCDINIFMTTTQFAWGS